MYIYIYVYMYMYIHTYIHTYIQTHIHTYIHIYIYTHTFIYDTQTCSLVLVIVSATIAKMVVPDDLQFSVLLKF